MVAAANTRPAAAWSIGLLLALFVPVVVLLRSSVAGGEDARALALVARPDAPAPLARGGLGASVVDGAGRSAAVVVIRDEEPVAPPSAAASGGEREALRVLRELARQRPEALPREVERLLRDECPDAHRVAALRALYEQESPRTEELFLLALTELPDVSGPQGESVPSFAVHYLGQRARHDPRARDILRALVVAPAPRGAADPRRRAAVLLAQAGTESDVEALGPVLAGDPDPSLARGVLSALRARADSPAALRLLARHGETLRPEAAGSLHVDR